MKQRIGLIAGVGRLPVEFTRAARGMGLEVIAIGVVPGVDQELSQVASNFYEISIGQLEAVLLTLKQEKVTEVTMLGKVTKELMFSGTVRPDARMQKLLMGLPDNSDDTVMLGFVRELAAEGMGVLDQTAFIRMLLPSPGILTKRMPTEAETKDMEFGLKMAKQIGGLDIGQTVVVKNQAVMAVEAIEGTDACIRRGGLLGRGEVIVAKVAKPNQDMRFDVPSVGPDTLNAMIEVKAAALVIEAGKTLLVNKTKVIEMADQYGITIAVM